jgi:hypothetical protein
MDPFRSRAKNEKIVRFSFAQVCWVEVCPVCPSNAYWLPQLLLEIIQIKFKTLQLDQPTSAAGALFVHTLSEWTKPSILCSICDSSEAPK